MIFVRAFVLCVYLWFIQTKQLKQLELPIH